jgi:predicted phage terminase large subunit-like protein
MIFMSVNEPVNLSNDELQFEGAKQHLRLFGQYVTPAWDWQPKHWKLIAQKLMQVERGEIKRLMIFSPPRHGKSELGTIHFPAWYMMRNPDKRVIITSYASTLADTFSRRIRQIFREYAYPLFGLSIASDSAKVDEWDIAGHHGKLIAAGVGGPITGQGASLLVIDDPFKNAEEANSPTMRQKVWDWFTSTAYTRLEPDGAIVLTLTRWHDDDLAGRLIKQMGDEDGEKWEILNLPALAEQNDPLGREEGDALWPKRFDVYTLNRIKRAVGTYVWSALYQQRPQDLQGGGFKAHWFKWYSKNEISYRDGVWYFRDERMTLFQGVDPAISEKTEADDFVIFTAGITETYKVIVFECYDNKLDFPEQVKTLIRKYQEWLPERVGVEINAYQRALKQQVVKEALVPVKQLDHRGDKFTRIMSMSPFFENAQVYLRLALDDESGYIDQSRIPDIRMHIKMKKFYEQAVTYSAKSSHDDCLDAFQNVFEIARPKMAQNEYYV